MFCMSKVSRYCVEPAAEYVCGYKSLMDVQHERDLIRQLDEQRPLPKHQKQELSNIVNQSAIVQGIYLFGGKIAPNIATGFGLYYALADSAQHPEWPFLILAGESTRIISQVVYRSWFHTRKLFRQFFKKHSLEARVERLEQS